MARHLRKKPSFDLIRHKIGEAHFFLQQITRHNELQRRPASLMPDRGWHRRVRFPADRCAHKVTAKRGPSPLGLVFFWHQTTCRGRLTMSAPEGKTDVPREPGHFRF